jgi:hypothetical protein
MPVEVATEAIRAYSAVLAMPYLDTRAFHHDLAAAAIGWTSVSTSWLLPRALADDPLLTHPARPTRTRRAMILHRLDMARRTGLRVFQCSPT